MPGAWHSRCRPHRPLAGPAATHTQLLTVLLALQIPRSWAHRAVNHTAHRNGEAAAAHLRAVQGEGGGAQPDVQQAVRTCAPLTAAPRLGTCLRRPALRPSHYPPANPSNAWCLTTWFCFMPLPHRNLAMLRELSSYHSQLKSYEKDLRALKQAAEVGGAGAGRGGARRTGWV